MRNLSAVMLAALMSMAAAFAQTTTVPEAAPAASAFGPDPIIQITTTFQARIEGVANARDVPTTTAQDTARRTLYNMAANECTVLAEYWKAECRLNSFAVYVSTAYAGEPDAPPSAPAMVRHRRVCTQADVVARALDLRGPWSKESTRRFLASFVTLPANWALA